MDDKKLLNEEEVKTINEVLQQKELPQEVEKTATTTTPRFQSTKNFNVAYRKKRRVKNNIQRKSRKANRK